MKLYRLFSLLTGLFIFSGTVNGDNPCELECFMVMAGKNATADGSVLLAHNNDLRGNNASFFAKIPAKKHGHGETIVFSSGLEIPQAEETYEWIVLQVYRGFAEGDAKAVNEHQVAIAGGVALGGDRNEKAAEADPMLENGLPGGIRYVVLERSETAREAVEMLGRKYSKYGITYPSGVGIADPDEVWYIEAGGGRSWAAVRVPDSAVWVQANGYRIQDIDPRDSANVIVSPGLLEFAEEKGLWDPSEGSFNFARAFGGRRLTREGSEHYDSRRVWGAMRKLVPSYNLVPDKTEYPMFVIPDEKLTVMKMTEILRDHYRGTEYDTFAGEKSGVNERAIAVPNCVHTSVIQLRGWLPSDIGAVLWGGPGSPLSTPFIPYYFGTEDFPEAFKTAGPAYDPGSAFWKFRTIQNLMTPYFEHLSDMVQSEWRKFEKHLFILQEYTEETALKLYSKNPELARQFLTGYSSGKSLEALEKAVKLAGEMHTEIAIISR